MAEFVALNCRVHVFGVDLSDHCKAIQFAANRDFPEATTFSNSWRRYLAGLKDLATSLKFNSDYASAKVDATLWTPWDAGTSGAVNIRPDAGAIATDNPEYQTTQFVENYPIINASVGQIVEQDITFKNASATITRDVTP